MKDAKARLFNPAANQLYHAQAKDQIPTRSARVFIKLLKAEQLPAWVSQMIDLDLLNAAAL